MAGISDLLLLPPSEDESDDILTVDSMDYWLQYSDRPFDLNDPFSTIAIPSDPSLHDSIVLDCNTGQQPQQHQGPFSNHFEIRELQISDSDLDSDSDMDHNLSEGDEVSIVLDFFDRSNSQTRFDSDHLFNPNLNATGNSDSRLFEENFEMGSNFLELGLGLGFGFDHESCDELIDYGGGDDTRDGFFVGNFANESGEFSDARDNNSSLQISVGIGSDTDSNDSRIAPVDFDLNSEGGDESDRAADYLGPIPLCWDCLRLDDEWEEVTDDNERGDRSIAIDASIDEELSLSNQESENSAETAVEVLPGNGWEVLLTVNNLEQNPIPDHDTESYLVDQSDYIYTTEYEVLFGQFADAENLMRGSPPAAKSVVENLPSVILTKEDVENNNAICAVCKDDISLEEQAKRLPCAHHYHGECILPWLGIRNTCPVCRFELPTDDPDYEHWRRQRSARGGSPDVLEMVLEAPEVMNVEAV